MSGKFHSSLYVKRLPDGSSKLTQPLIYESAEANGIITVPRGFETDFASVPRMPFAYLLFGGVADEAAVVHDFIYSRRLFPRAKCDAIFREAMAACGVAGWRRWPMWLGTRVGGWAHY